MSLFSFSNDFSLLKLLFMTVSALNNLKMCLPVHLNTTHVPAEKTVLELSGGKN